MIRISSCPSSGRAPAQAIGPLINTHTHTTEMRPFPGKWLWLPAPALSLLLAPDKHSF